MLEEKFPTAALAVLLDSAASEPLGRLALSAEVRQGVAVAGATGSGTAGSKRAAEQAAATDLLGQLAP